MPQSHGSPQPPLVFSVGCLFVLLVTSIQVWRTHESQPFPALGAATLTDVYLSAPRPQYTAVIRAENALPRFELPRAAVPAGPVAARFTIDGPPPMDASFSLDQLPWEAFEPLASDELPTIWGDSPADPRLTFSDLGPLPLPPPQRLPDTFERQATQRPPSSLSHQRPLIEARPPVAELDEQAAAEERLAGPTVREGTNRLVATTSEAELPSGPSVAAMAEQEAPVPPPTGSTRALMADVSESLILPRQMGLVTNDADDHPLDDVRLPAVESFPPPVQASDAKAMTPDSQPVRSAPVVKRLAKPTRKRRTKKDPVEGFPRPIALLKSAEILDDPAARDWVERLRGLTDELQEVEQLIGVDAQPPLQRLGQLEREANQLAPQLSSHSAQSQLLTLSYALRRRLATYEAVRSALHPQVVARVEQLHARGATEGMLAALDNAWRVLSETDTAEQWTEFLSLRDIERLARSQEHAEDRIAVATLTLDRMTGGDLTPEQQSIMEHPALLRLRDRLREWSTAPMNYERLLAAVEHYEAQPSSNAGFWVARQASQLQWSLVPQQNRLGQVLDSHYRNANVRVALTQRFFDRMLPVIQDSQDPIRTEILGAKVFGNSASWTRIGIRLVPDPQRIHLQLQASGIVAADTRAFKGPVVTFNRNRSEFFLSKPIIVDHDGVFIGQSNTIARGTSNLMGLKTNYDNYPFLGSIVRRAAKQQIFEQRNLTRRILERRVANSAEQKIDEGVTHELAVARHNIDTKILAPLRHLELDPAAISMQTTEQRVVFRGRLAGTHQLAGHTARPRALADNLISLQIHESTANNALEQLGLNGCEGNLRQLLQDLTTQVKNIDPAMIDEVPDNVEIKLADRDALRVSFEDDRIHFTLRIERLTFRRSEWTNFAVSANYLPETRGFQIELGRDGIVELIGRRLNFSDQVALRGIFGKVFSKNRNIPMIIGALASDERLSDLAFSQLVLRDGWLGLSVDDEQVRTARRAAWESSTGTSLH